MKRRLYFLFPDTAAAQAAVSDLTGIGVERAHMHTLARRGTDLGDLPAATPQQRHGLLQRIERILWNGNLLLFLLALVWLVVAVLLDSLVGAVLAGAVLVASLIGGILYTHRRPSLQFDEFRAALAHGEILLLVDVARERVEGVETLMHQRHPNAVTGGSAWTPDVFGV